MIYDVRLVAEIHLRLDIAERFQPDLRFCI